ncbi:MAG: FAD-dependent oxidoreductase [Acidobacteriota bacterium]|nr:FAD-dependent oxidoreductase [Acidobacteriota bacterium]
MTQPLHRAIIRRIWGECEHTRRFEFELVEGPPFVFRAGQFISLHFNSNGGRIALPYSIAAHLPGRRFELCVNILPGSPEGDSWFRNAKVGESLEFTGPFGAFKLHQPPDGVSAFVATGTGIAPIRAMIHELYRSCQPKEAWLIFGVRREADIVYWQEFESLAREHPSLHFIPTLSRPGPDWKGHRGYVQVQVQKYLDGKTGLHAYICGSPQMIAEVRELLNAMGYPPDAISFERFE